MIFPRFIGSFFQIYSMALKDNLQENESYYIVEIKSLKRILSHADEDIPMLCFVDEVLRGQTRLSVSHVSAQILKSSSQEAGALFCSNT